MRLLVQRHPANQSFTGSFSPTLFQHFCPFSIFGTNANGHNDELCIPTDYGIACSLAKPREENPVPHSFRWICYNVRIFFSRHTLAFIRAQPSIMFASRKTQRWLRESQRARAVLARKTGCAGVSFAATDKWICLPSETPPLWHVSVCCFLLFIVCVRLFSAVPSRVCVCVWGIFAGIAKQNIHTCKH